MTRISASGSGYLAGDIYSHLLGLHQMLPAGSPLINSEILGIDLRRNCGRRDGKMRQRHAGQGPLHQFADNI